MNGLRSSREGLDVAKIATWLEWNVKEEMVAVKFDFTVPKSNTRTKNWLAGVVEMLI